jgi:hypothetical protein
MWPFKKQDTKTHASKCASHKCKYDGDGKMHSNFEMRECDCDGYHSFSELYDHRIALYIALCRMVVQGQNYNDTPVWRSKLHFDGTSFDGWYILGIDSRTGSQISYHLPLSTWDQTDFAETRERAWPWDGHTSDDVLERLKQFNPIGE